MKKGLFTLLALAFFAANAFGQAYMSERLLAEISKAEAKGTPVKALVMLKDQADIQKLDAELYAMKASLEYRAYTVITALQKKADETQGSVMNVLAAKRTTEVLSYKSFWIVNMIAVEAVPSVLYELSRHEDVGSMDIDAELKYDEPVKRGPAKKFSPGGAEPGLKAINAHLMWAAGFTGAGYIVMNDDTGVQFQHPALFPRWRGNFASRTQAWFDSGSPSSADPTDCDGHGTHTMGTMTGLDPATNDTVGVAFGAQWIASKGICSSPHASNSIGAWQWAMNPDSNAGTITDMPVAIGNSWFDPDIGSDCSTDPAQNPYYNAIISVEASGIAIVFSAGNSGPGTSTITKPKNMIVDLTTPFTTGAVNANTSWPYTIASFSSRGPSTCNPASGPDSLRLKLKPEICAPGEGVRSSYPTNSYSSLDGTSMACPHVVGALTLLRQAHPGMTGKQLKMALYETARDLGTPGEDDTYGMGMIDVWAAHMSLGDPSDPREPGAFTAYSDYTTPTSVELNWTDPDRFVNGDTLINFDIVVYRDGSEVATVAAGLETYVDTNRIDGTFHNYSIKARALPSDSLSMAVNASAYAGGSPVPAAPGNLSVLTDTTHAYLTWSNPTTQSDGTPLDDLAKIFIYRNGVLIDSVDQATTDTTYTDTPPQNFSYEYSVKAVDNETPRHISASSNTVTAFVGSVPSYLVWVGPDAAGESAASGDSIFAALIANGESAFLTDNLFEFGSDLSVFDGIFVVLGIYSNNHVISESDPEGAALETYLQNGGRVYLEGGDCFNFDPDAGGYNIRPWFGLDPGNDGGSDIAGVNGLNDLSAFTFSYNGENNWMDDLVPNGSVPVWQNNANTDIAGVFNVSFATSRTIGVVPSFGGMMNSTESLNKVKRTFANDIDHRIEKGSVKPLIQRGPKKSFVKKAAYYPALKSNRKKAGDLYRITAAGVEILANNKTDLMAAYIGLFWNTGAPTISVDVTSITDTLEIGAGNIIPMTISNVGGSLAGDLTFSIAENPSATWITEDPTVDTVHANQSKIVTVSLNAAGLTVGPYTTTLDITTNDTAHPLVSIPVNLVVVEAPIMSLAPDSFDYDLYSGEMFTDSFKVYNTGSGTLHYNTTVEGAVAGAEEVVFGADGDAFSGGTRGRGNHFFITNDVTVRELKYGLNVTSNGTQVEFVIFESAVASGVYNRVFSTIQMFNTTGDFELLSSGPMNYTLESGKYYFIGAVWDNACGYIGLDPNPLPTYSWGDLIAGHAGGVIVTFPSEPSYNFDPSPDDGAYYGGLATGTAFDLTIVTGESGTVASNDSAYVVFHGNTAGLFGGNYMNYIHVTGNDPSNSTQSVDIDVEVTGVPDIAVSPGLLDFGSHFITYPDTMEFTVTNTGTDVLTVVGLSTSTTQFSVVTAYPFNVPVSSSAKVKVRFMSASAATYVDTVLVVNNGNSGVQRVALTGTAIAPPAIGVSSTDIISSVGLGDTSATEMVIRNTGLSDLTFSIAESEDVFTYLKKPVNSKAPRAADINYGGPHSIGKAPGVNSEISGNTLRVFAGNAMNAFAVKIYPAPNEFSRFDLSNPGTFVVKGTTATIFAGDCSTDGSTYYAFNNDDGTFGTIDTTNGSYTVVGTLTGITSGQSVTGITVDPTNETIYLSTTNITSSELYSVNPVTAAATLIGNMTGMAGAIDIAVNPDGQMYGFCIVTDHFYSIDKATGAATDIGALGFNANYAQGMDFDPNDGTCYLAAYSTQGELRTVDLNTGATTLIGAFPGGAEVDGFAILSLGLQWIDALPMSGTVAAGDSTTINLSWYGIEAGVHEGYLGISSNDPSAPMTNVHVQLTTLVGIDNGIDLTPNNYALHQNYPNPFNPTTTIKYDLKDAGKVTLKVYNILGQEVRTLVNTNEMAGFKSVVWDGKDNSGKAVSSGLYIYRLETGKFTKSHKMMLLK